MSQPSTASLLPDDRFSELSLLVTDEEFLVILQGMPGALLKVFPEGEPVLAPSVGTAVKRSLVARRAVTPEEDGTLALREPWATLVDVLTGPATVCRVTSDQDDQRALLVLDSADAVIAIERDPTGINTVLFSSSITASELIGARLVHDEGVLTDDSLVTTEPSRLPYHRLSRGRDELFQGQAAEAEQTLGAAYPLFLAAGATHRIETVHVTPDGLAGSEFDVLDAHDMGWVTVEYAGDDGIDVVVHQRTDAEVAGVVAAALQA